MALDRGKRIILGNEYAESPFMDVPAIRQDDLEMRVAEKFLYGEHKIPGYFFSVVVEGQEAGTFVALLEDNLDRVREARNVGIELDRNFLGRELPTKTVELMAPTLKKHGVKSLIIAFDKENKSIRRACDNLGAKYRDTIKDENGN